MDVVAIVAVALLPMPPLSQFTCVCIPCAWASSTHTLWRTEGRPNLLIPPSTSSHILPECPLFARRINATKLESSKLLHKQQSIFACV